MLEMPYLQRPMIDVSSSWKPPKISELPTWENVKRIAVDTETRDPFLKKLGLSVRRGGYIAGISFAIEDGPAYYLPIRHQASEDNLDERKVLRYLADQAKVFRGELVGMNLPYDLDYLAEAGVVFRNVSFFRDVSIAAMLCNELYPRNSLNDILSRYGLPQKQEQGLNQAAKAWGLNAKSDMWRMPGRHVAKYAIADVTLPLQLMRRIERDIDEQDLWQIWDLESKVLPVAVKIRRRGVRINEDRLDRICQWGLGQEQTLLERVKHSTGIEIPCDDLLKKDLTEAALNSVGVMLPKTASGQPSTDADTLKSIDHDVARWILKAKKYHKMRNDFAGSIRRHLVNGRIHSTFRQIKGTTEGKDDESGAAYGRFSSKDPNLQQQYSPEKEPEISAMWREIFLPEDDSLWASCDYSAQEPRMIVHYAALARCTGGQEMVDKYLANPRLDLHQSTADLCAARFTALGIPEDKHRKSSKEIFLGRCYGMGGAKLCDKLGLPTDWWQPPKGPVRRVAGEEGKRVTEAFNQMVPFLTELAEAAATRANKMGYVRTLLGRKCRFPRLKSPRKFRGKLQHYDWVHKALNRIVQGGSADQGKKALVDADAAGHFIQIPVHDELCGSVSSEKQGKEIAEIMENAVELLVPSVVDVAVGKSWGEAQ